MEGLFSTNGAKIRIKERTLKEVIEKVSFWRKLFSGVVQDDGKILKLSLE